MTRKTFDDWKILVEKQIASGLTVPQFCHRHNLSAKYFYARKSKVLNASNNAGFIQAHVMTNQTTLLTTETKQTIKLHTSSGELSLPGDTSAQFIIELLNGLAS